MNRSSEADVRAIHRPPSVDEGRRGGVAAPPCSATSGRRAVTLVELLVVVSIILALMVLLGGAVSSVRNSAKAFTTANAISRLDQIITTQFRRYESRSVPASVINSLGQQIPNPSAARAWHIRRNVISAEMPDRWTDVAYMASAGGYPRSGAQVAYIATWNGFTSTQRTIPGWDPAQHVNFTYGGAECLFMIIMQGGFADCLDCNGLAALKKGDKDGDGALEFWDEWNNPIDYILWAPGTQRSGGSDAVFTSLDLAFPATGSVRPGLGMRPLIYSPGPDGEYGLERNGEAKTLDRGSTPVVGGGCGNAQDATTATSGGPTSNSGDRRRDNILNVEAKTGT